MGLSARRLISTGSPFEREAGYSRAVVQGNWCFVAGTTGYDYATMRMPDAVQAQAENAFATLGHALDDAGFSLSDIVRINYVVADPAFADDLFKVSGQHLRDIRPAAMLIVAGLLKPERKIEIEATAFRG